MYMLRLPLFFVIGLPIGLLRTILAVGNFFQSTQLMLLQMLMRGGFLLMDTTAANPERLSVRPSSYEWQFKRGQRFLCQSLYGNFHIIVVLLARGICVCVWVTQTFPTQRLSKLIATVSKDPEMPTLFSRQRKNPKREQF